MIAHTAIDIFTAFVPTSKNCTRWMKATRYGLLQATRVCAACFFLFLIKHSTEQRQLGEICDEDSVIFKENRIFQFDIYATELAMGLCLPYLGFVFFANLCKSGISNFSLDWDLPITNTILFPAAAVCFKRQPGWRFKGPCHTFSTKILLSQETFIVVLLALVLSPIALGFVMLPIQIVYDSIFGDQPA